MTFLINMFGTKILGLLILFAQSSFQVHTVYKEITPIGWAVIIILPLALIFGIIFSIVKILKKPKLK